MSQKPAGDRHTRVLMAARPRYGARERCPRAGPGRWSWTRLPPGAWLL